VEKVRSSRSHLFQAMTVFDIMLSLSVLQARHRTAALRA
jgi:hypothetical protein